MLDLVFVVVFEWGVAGVAYATIISQFASAVLVLIVLTRSDTAYGSSGRQIRIRRGMLGRIMAIGFPSGIQQAHHLLLQRLCPVLHQLLRLRLHGRLVQL